MTDIQVEAGHLALGPFRAFNTHSDARVEGSEQPASEESIGHGTSYFLATDWQLHQGSRQSGLPYLWRDGLPLVPEGGPWRKLQLVLKRTMDVAGALTGLFVLSPLLLAVAVAMKLTDPGPVLFRQRRIGHLGREFLVYKFRTMHFDRCDHSGRAQTVADDERITRLGRILREKSIDELPQLLNVLLGHMSLVGPRPHVSNMLAAGQTYETLVPYYPLRHAMKPGITGWAQGQRLPGPHKGGGCCGRPSRPRPRLHSELQSIARRQDCSSDCSD